MRRILLIGILAALVLVAVISGVALAQDDSQLSINMTGVTQSRFIIGMSGVGDSLYIINTPIQFILWPPTGLLFTVISDNEVGINWTMGDGACYTMVRKASGRYPTDRDDGTLVYYGNATYVQDWSSTDIRDLHYTLWSQSCAGTWEDTGVSGTVGGASLIQIALLLIPLAFTGYMFGNGNSGRL